MNEFISSENEAIEPVELSEVQKLRKFEGSWKEFWPEFLSKTGQFIKAHSGILIFKAEKDWRQISSWGNQDSTAKDKVIQSVFIRWLENNQLPQVPVFHKLSEESNSSMTFMLITPLVSQDSSSIILALYMVAVAGEANVRSKLERLSLINDIPVSYQDSLSFAQARSSIEAFATASDVLILLNRQKRFLAANMTLCNELASRFSCDRVSIGWLKDQNISVTAISHMEKFEKKMDAVRELQASMEESLEQNSEILFPPPTDAHYISRDHLGYSKSQGINHIFSIPLRKKDEAVSVITFERDRPFSEQEQLSVRLVGDQVTQRMLDLQKWDRWFGSRCYYWFKEKMKSLLNVEFTLRKAVCIIGVAVFIWMVFGRLDYRVKAPFILRSENVRFVPAPNDGYIKEVNIEKGDFIPSGSLLLNLDNRELLLEESAAVADKVRFEREISKARAENRLVEMRIAEAQLQQAEARLEKIRYFIDQAKIKSPFDGVVVEGDLKEKIGVPVRQGDLLYKIAQLDTLYSELKVAEDDIHELHIDNEGYLAFASQPDEKFPVVIDRIEPLAQSMEEGNIFIVRCRFTGNAEDWWRPGMSGIAKIKVDRRSPLFLLTHKTLDYLRLRFW